MARMKGAKARKKNPVGKKPAGTKKDTRRSVEEYLAGVAEPARGTLKKIRAAIRSAAPAETIEVISYGIPAFKYKVVLVWYAAFAEHCSLFLTAAVIEAFEEELEGYRISKGTIQFPVNEPLPEALVRKMVKARVAHVEKKKR